MPNSPSEPVLGLSEPMIGDCPDSADIYSIYLNIAAEKQRENKLKKSAKSAPNWQDQCAARRDPN